MLAGSGVLLVAGQGSVVEQVIQAGSPLPDATASSSPAGAGPFYDGVSSITWDTDRTSTRGVGSSMVSLGLIFLRSS